VIKLVNSPEVLFNIAVTSVYNSHWNMWESHTVGTGMFLSDSTGKTSHINLLAPEFGI